MTRIDLSLSRISRLLALLPPPTWKAVHIAGTNGKGSVAAYLTTLLRRNVRYNDYSNSRPELLDDESRRSSLAKEKLRFESTNLPRKFNVGRFTSPHFIDRWDCITINNQSVSRDLFLEVEAEVKLKADEVDIESRRLRTAHQSEDVTDDARDETITPFELLTATAFSIFTKAKVHIAVVECGLGGRLDATNAMQDSSVALSIITRLGLDHINLLGDTIEEITREKAGIFRHGVPIVADDENETSIKAVIKAESEIRNAGKLSFASWHNLAQNPREGGAHGTDQVSDHESTAVEKVTANELMPHQRANCAIAITALRVLAKQNWKGQLCPQFQFPDLATNSQIHVVLSDALDEANQSYPGRLQKLHPSWTRSIMQTDLSALEKAHVLVDGAHNAQSATVLRNYVNKIITRAKDKNARCRIFWILAMSQGKNSEEILRILIQPGDALVLSEFGSVDGMPWVRSQPASVLEETANRLDSKIARLETSSNILQALTKIVTRVKENSKDGLEPVVVVAGSLYLVSDLLRLMREGVYSDGLSQH